jgi:hypothetical protein
MEIPEIKLIPAPETEEARRVIGYQWNEKAGRRHKPGGKPNFTQGQQWPVCSHCQEQMTVVFQK